ncbi:MAG: heat-inducible transcriptional repressor HrcA [Clostridia bacterium]|nr:heat-inducible transcriptional repressor HrcA [Clostridia bacterium]
MELTERKLKILQAIISDYVKTAEPVGSRTLSRRLDMNISPATIRNEMSDLEEMGYLTHPHTSAGRVPSDKAYRLYVNQLMEKPVLSVEEKAAIANELQADINEFERTIKHAAKILSRITNLTSFAVTPTRNEDSIKFVNLLPVDDQTVVMMIVSESGEISNTALKLQLPCSPENLQLLAKSMTYSFRGKKLTEVREELIKSFKTNVEAMGKLEQDIMPDFLKTLDDMLNVQLYMDGLTNIFNIPEYSDIESAKNFLTMLDQKEDFLKTVVSRDDGVIVTIGDENMSDQMADYSMITATYSVDGKTVGKIGVIGPKRMKYGEVTSIMEYLTENLNNSFQLESGGEKTNDE